MTDEIAQRRAARALEQRPAEHDVPPRVVTELRATVDGIVELDVPSLDGVVLWTPDEAEAFARDLVFIAARARENGKPR